MNFHVTAKLGNMRKAQSFIVYPLKSDATHIILQSDKRVASIEIATGNGMLSDGKGSYQPFVKLSPRLGAMPITVGREFIDECLKAKPPANAAGQVSISSLIGGRNEATAEVVPSEARQDQRPEVGSTGIAVPA